MNEIYRYENYLKKPLEIIFELLVTQYGENAANAWTDLKSYKYLNKKLKTNNSIVFETKCDFLIESFDKTTNPDTKTQLLSLVPHEFARETIRNSLGISHY